MAHLTTPATVWKYVESACTKSAANLVMLDLEDSIPAGDDAALAVGRSNVIRAFRELDWGSRLRFFRPRGRTLDPEFEDLRAIVTACGDRVEGLVYPKVEDVDDVLRLDRELAALDPSGRVRIEVLIESVRAEEQAFEIGRASRRLAGLIYGAFDWWSSLGMVGERDRKSV